MDDLDGRMWWMTLLALCSFFCMEEEDPKLCGSSNRPNPTLIAHGH